MTSRYDVVVPTVGRPSLATLLRALAEGDGPPPGQVILVDDRRERSAPLVPSGPPPGPAPRLRVLAGRGAGPAAARNVGWQAATAEWVAFLDDDVEPAPDWPARLAADLAGLGPDVAGSQGRLRVPLPEGRRRTDWERNVAGLASSRWVTADMAYRRAVLAEVGGFDERFRRAYREDAELALRVQKSGYRLVRGERVADHPPRPAGPWVSVRLQAGNADDVLMARLHGPRWREEAGAPRGRRARHQAVTAAAVVGVAGAAARRPLVAAAGGAAWLAGTAELAWARVAPGPRTPGEVATMVATSAVLPVAATASWLRGLARHRGVRAWAPPRPAAVLFDRDGTLVRDVPYNGDPGRVEPMPGARQALDRLRRAGIPVGVVSNQSGVARGLLTDDEVWAVNRRVEELLGPMATWAVCPHGPDDGCGCRKPAPGLVVSAASALGVDPARCAVVGDIGSDVAAARAAGARPILVPTPVTRPEETRAAPEVAQDLVDAVDRLLRGAP